MPFGVAIATAAATAYAADKQNDASKRASRAQRDQNATEREFILQQTDRARDDVQALYGNQAQNSMMGGQAALDILRGALPQQAAFMNQGSNNAMAAILGGQVGNFAAPDFSFIPSALPQYKSQQTSVLGVPNSAANGGASPATPTGSNQSTYAKRAAMFGRGRIS